MIPEPADGRRRASLDAWLEINRRIPVGVLAAWALLYASRPFRLGFYIDDWWSLVEPTHGNPPFSLERLHQFMGLGTAYATRPVDGILMFLVNSTAGTSAFTYQVIAAVFALLAALSLRAWLAGLLDEHDFPSRHLAADLAAIFWLSLPWSVASTAWPVLAPAAMGSQILLTEASRRLLPPRRVTAKSLALVVIALVASYLTYEVFYFQFLIVVGFYLAFKKQTFKTLFSSTHLIIAALVSQLLAIAYNQLVSSIEPRLSKKFSPTWFIQFLASMHILPRQLEDSLGAFGKLWMGIVVTCLVVALVLAARGLIDTRLFRPTRRLIGISVMGAVAVNIAVLTFSLAGYGILSAGITARTLQGVSWAIAIIFFSLSSLLLLSHVRLAKLILLFAFPSIIVLNCIAQERVLEDWAFVWRQEKQVLAHAPVEKLKMMPGGSRVLYIGPSYYHSMVIFGADWDITGAVNSLPALSRGRRHYRELIRIHSAGMYHWLWDGKDLVQEEPGYFKASYPATRLFVWKYEQGEIVEVPAGYRLAPEEIQKLTVLSECRRPPGDFLAASAGSLFDMIRGQLPASTTVGASRFQRW